MKKLVILDRDGVINEDSDDFIKSPQEWVPIDGSLNAIAKLNHAGYLVAIATNQSGIARGLYDLEVMNEIHQKMNHMLSKVGGHIDGTIFCPHGRKDNCDCRKPKGQMLLELSRRFRVPVEQIVAVGDSLRDLQAAESAHIEPVLVKTGKGEKTFSVLKENTLTNTKVFATLSDFTSDFIVSNRK